MGMRHSLWPDPPIERRILSALPHRESIGFTPVWIRCRYGANGSRRKAESTAAGDGRAPVSEGRNGRGMDDMVTLLAKWLIRTGKPEDADNSQSVRRAYGVLCGAVGVALNILLFLGKLFAGSLSGSIAIMADAFNNLSDAGSSVITLIGFRMAGQKPDPEHPFGHGRIEYISGFIVAIAILLMGFELLTSSIEKIASPEPVAFSGLTAAILIVSILVKLYMCFYNRQIGKRIDSAAMRATAMDSLSDCIATTVVLAAMLIGHWTNLMIDGWCGLLVALFILYAGLNAAKETIGPLLGEPPSKEFVEQIEQYVLSHEAVIGIHDLVVHNYGPGRTMISLHAEVPAGGDILELHDLIDNIEHGLRERMGCEAVIHMDPVITDDAALNALCETVRGIATEIDPTITIHDFRMVAGPTHTNLIFDAVVPYRCRLSDEAVCKAFEERIRALDDGNYFAVVEIDKAFVV